ncbi:MAG: YitT family protein [Flavobacteriales bacterium]|nr:YitT family protein [Flavobacteriales bacterium]
MNQFYRKTEIKNYIFIFFGCLFLSFGMVAFLIPNKIATGGIAGLSIIFHHLFGLPAGTVLALVNIPLLLVSVKYLGKKFALRTVVVIALASFFIDLLAEGFNFPVLSTNTLLATLYGGVSIGIGLGLIFKGDASAGAGTILAKILNDKWGTKTGDVILVIDAIVVVLAGVVFKDVELALWSLISIYVTSKLIDIILTGKRNEKIVHIASDNLEKLSQIMEEELGFTGTILKGKDLNFSHERNIIFVVVDMGRLSALRNLVQEFDPKAFMVVMEASELLAPTKNKIR